MGRESRCGQRQARQRQDLWQEGSAQERRLAEVGKVGRMQSGLEAGPVQGACTKRSDGSSGANQSSSGCDGERRSPRELKTRCHALYMEIEQRLYEEMDLDERILRLKGAIERLARQELDTEEAIEKAKVKLNKVVDKKEERQELVGSLLIKQKEKENEEKARVAAEEESKRKEARQKEEAEKVRSAEDEEEKKENARNTKENRLTKTRGCKAPGAGGA